MTELTAASKRFGEKIILDRQSIVFPDGGITCLTGESGCGKTTLLRILSGLCALDSGTVTLPRSVSCSFQEPRLFPQLNVIENVCVTADRETAFRLLSALDLADACDKYPGELSGGMRQRVSVARALGADAELYLFDEPTAALDDASSMKCTGLISEHLAGKSVIISTHSSLVREICDSVIQMENGILRKIR